MPNSVNDIKSPCVKRCCLDDKDICLGCFRHLDEILIWSQASADEKKQILERSAARRK